MPVKLYVDLRSQPCRAVIIFARMNGIKYELHELSMLEDTRTDWFRKITPMTAVPVLQEDDFILTESMAIIWYLRNTNKTDSHWYPDNVKQRARVDEYINWHFSPGGLRRNGSMAFIEQAVKPYKTKKPVNQEELATSKQNLESTLDKLEEYFLTRGDYIAGSADVTVADLIAICSIMQPLSVGFPIVQWPKLTAWVERTQNRLQPHFDDLHKNILEFGSKYRLQ